VKLSFLPENSRDPSGAIEWPTRVDLINPVFCGYFFWDQVFMTEDDDRGYLIVAWVCQNGAYI